MYLVLAALLHDIGKLYQRAYSEPPDTLPDGTHTAYTSWFIEQHASLFEAVGLSASRLADTAKRHHTGPQWQAYHPSTPEEWTVHLAAKYASGEEGDDEPTNRNSISFRALQPIFSSLRLGASPQASSYPLNPLAEGTAYPVVGPILDLDPTTYQQHLVSRLEQRLQELAALRPTSSALVMNLLGFLQEVCWCVSANPQGKSDVSLYDHLRLTAAIAAPLWRYHEAEGEVRSEQLQDESVAKFLLVVGDVSGIQDHIYKIKRAQTGTGALAKRLRARSLEISLVTEAMATGILDELELLPLQRIMGAGGKFYLLLPNTAQTHEVLQETRRVWDAYCLDQGGSLVPYLVSTALRPNEFKNFQRVLARAHEALAEAKLRPFVTRLASPYLFTSLPSATPDLALPTKMCPHVVTSPARCLIKPSATGS